MCDQQDKVRAERAYADASTQAGVGQSTLRDSNQVPIYEIHLSRHGQVDEIHGPYTAEDIIGIQMKLSNTIGIAVRIVKRYGRQVY